MEHQTGALRYVRQSGGDEAESPKAYDDPFSGGESRQSHDVVHGVHWYGKSTTALIAAVVQTNLQAIQELLRAENPKVVLELQRRFACEYAAVLMQGTMALVDAIESAAAD